MTRPKRLKSDTSAAAAADVEHRYAHRVAQLIGIRQPTNLYWVAGRASAKTVQVLAERVQEAATECPGAPFAWVADTYADLHRNVIPSLMDGLRLLGWEDGRDFVVGKRPPESWSRRMYNITNDYRQMMVFRSGFNFSFISLDRPAIGAGRSYVGIFGDEVKYFPEERYTNLLKAVRGFRVKYGDNVWYRSRTLTTDMPDPSHRGEHDWILKLAGGIDPERLLLLARAGFVYNRTKQEYAAALTAGDARRTELARRTMERWQERHRRLRRGATLFLVSSTYVNADVLGEEFFDGEIAEGLEGLRTNILSIRPRLAAGNRFYVSLTAANFYADGNLNEVLDRHPYGWQPDCTLLRHLDPDRPIDAGMDSGNMLSLVVGQRTARVERILKEFYTLPPHGVRELADSFLTYFAPHRRRILKLYYDRSMNNYRGVGTDMASQIKKNIEVDAGGERTGWQVQLMSLGQGNIGSNLEYRFFTDLLSGHLQSSYGTLLIDRHNCPALKSEMEVTATTLKENHRTGTSILVKKKTGDRLPISRLAHESTNLTDALKYYVLRREVIRTWQRGRGSTAAAVV
jgi:hypothetical protein